MKLIIKLNHINVIIVVMVINVLGFAAGISLLRGF